MGGHAASSNGAIGGSGRRRGCHGMLPAGFSEGGNQMRGTVGGGEERREEKVISFLHYVGRKEAGKVMEWCAK